MEHMLLPTSITFEGTDQPHVGRLVITPCQQGYGTTLGNALRRVLLSSLPGAAVESVKIEGVQHEFGAVDGVLEDMVEIILNLKQLALRLHADMPVTLHLKKSKKGDVTAADFETNADVDIINSDLKICTLTTDDAFDMEIIVGRGLGYVPVSEKETKNLDLGTIMIDSLYTPIRDVGYKVENTRVGDVTDYEKLIMTIETDGTITPKESVEQATKILMDHFALIMDMKDAPTSFSDESEMEASDDEEEATSKDVDADEA